MTKGEKVVLAIQILESIFAICVLIWIGYLISII